MSASNDRHHRHYHPETRLIHGPFISEHWSYEDHIVPPMSASVAYRLESAERGARGFQSFANPELSHGAAPIYIYDRLDEPTRGLLEERLSKVEGGECAVTYATGMAAISAALGVASRSGDTILCHRTIYGCTFSLLTNWYPRLGINVNALHRRQIDHQAVIHCCPARHIVAAAAHGYFEPEVATEFHCVHHIGRAGTAGDHGGMLVDQSIVDAPGLIITGIPGPQKLSSEALGEGVDGFGLLCGQWHGKFSHWLDQLKPSTIRRRRVGVNNYPTTTW